MPNYTNIGVPRLNWNVNPLDEANRIARKTYHAPSTSPLDRQRRAVQDVIDRENRKKEQAERYQQFLQQQRDEADKIRKKKQKDLSEVDKAVREEQREFEKERDAEFENSFQAYIDDLATNKTTGQINENKRKNADNSLNRWFYRQAWDMNNWLGSLNKDRHATYMDSLSGRVSMNQIKETEADAHIQMLEIDRNIEAIKNQKQLLLEQLNTPVNDSKIIFTEEYQNKQRQIQSAISECDAQIQALQRKKNDPQLKQLDDEYKLSFMRDNGGMFSYIWGEIKDLPKEFISSQEERNKIVADRRNRMLAQYPQYLAEYVANRDKSTDDKARDRQNAIVQGALYANKDKDPQAYSHVNADIAIANEIDAANKYKEDLHRDNENIKKKYTEEAKLLQDSQNYWNMAKSMEKGKEIYANAGLFDWNYWRYQAGSMIGSSNSSPDQMIANAIQTGSTLAGAAIGGVVSGGSGAGVGAAYGANVGALASVPFQASSGVDENYGETSQKRSESLKNALMMQQVLYSNKKVVPWIINTLKKQSVDYFKSKGMNDKWIHDRYFNGTDEELTNVISDYLAGISKCNHPILKQAMLDSGKGISAQFWADNVRTMGELPVQVLMSMYPTRYVKKAGEVTREIAEGAAKNTLKSKVGQAVSSAAQKAKSAVLSTKAGKVVSNTIGKRISETVAERVKPYTNGFRRGIKSFGDRAASSFETGENIAESLGYGYAGKKVIGAATAAANEVLHQGSKLIGADAVAAARDLTEDIMRKYQMIYDKILPKDWMRIAAAYGMNTARRGFMSAASEGAEEGVQYLNSKEDFASKYGYSSASLGDLIINDFVQGGRIKDAYLSLFGIGNSPLDDDLEFWQNVKGGFALGGLGGLNPGQVINVAGNVRNAVLQYKTNQIIANSAVLDRSMDQKERASNFTFAKLAMANREAEVANRMQQLYDEDRRRENTILTQEAYDEKTRAASAVMQMTKDKQIKQMLEAKGIHYGTDEYATAIADLYTLRSQQSQNQSETSKNNTKLSQLYSSPEFKQAVQDVADRLKKDTAFQISLSRRRVEAGEKAVKDRIEAAKKAGIDTTTPEFTIELQQIRKDAQKQVEDQINDRLNDVIQYKSSLVNKAKALLKFKAQQNSAKDFFDLLSNKLNLRTVRPDAKTIMDNTTSQIDEIKKQLKELDPDLNLGKTEADFLKAVESIDDVVTQNTDEIQQYELNSSVLRADAAVTSSYLNQFGYGLVKNKKGKYEYNRKQYENEQNRAQRLLTALLAGNKEEAEKIKQEDVTAEYNEEDVLNNEYKTRIGKIIEADQQNMALDAMVADAYSGDLINQYMDQLKQEAQTQQQKKPTETTKPVATDPVSNETTPETNRSKWSRNKRSRNAKIAKNRELYEQRKKKAKQIYNKIKKQLRGNAYGSIIPGLPQLAQASAYLMQKAATGAYKINELVQDLKEIISDIDVDAILPEIKNIYNKYAAKVALLNPDLLNNFSTPEEVLNYSFEDKSKEAQVDVYSTVQQQLDEDANKIESRISSYYYTAVQLGDPFYEPNVVFCENTEALEHRDERIIKRAEDIVKRLSAVIDSEDKFTDALIKETRALGISAAFPIESYTKYRKADGALEAIANHLLSYNPSVGIINGIKARNAVLGILLDDKYLLEDVQEFRGIDEFVKDITTFKNQLKKAGYHVVAVNESLFDVNLGVSAQADVICINDNGDVQVIDVLSSYASIADRYNYKPGRNATYSIREREEGMLHQIEEILFSKFNIKVKSLSVLPIHCDKNEIFVQKSNGKIQWQFVKPNISESTENDIQAEQLEQSTKQQVSEVNDIIDQYNGFITENKVSEKQIPHSEWVEQPSVDQYESYSENLQHLYEEVNQKLHQIQDNLQKKIDEDKRAVIEDMPYLDEEIPQAVDDQVSVLVDACRELDVALSETPEIKATTKEEKDAVNNLYKCIFEAQQALNDVLLNEDTSIVDVSSEQELIASAMEKLAENPNFTKLQKFVQKWWLDNIVLNTSKSNTEFVAKTPSQQFVSYVNTIDGWINTLYQHVMSDLENYPALQDWYDTLLNVYFNKLLDNAQKFADTSAIKDEYKNTLNEKIQDGRNMLQDFNGQFSMRPDKEYPTAPKDEAEKLNRISQKYSDLYTETTAHSPAFDAMLYSDPYYFMSRHDDFAEKAIVTFEIAKKDRQVRNKRNGFGYDIKAGDVIMLVRYQNPDGSYNFAELPLVTSDGYKPSNDPEVINRIRKINNVNKKFSEIVKRALDIVAKDPNKKLAYTVGVHRGKIRYGKRSERHNVSEFIFGDGKNKQDLYTITLSKDNHIGIAAFTIDAKTGEMGYGVYGGNELRTRIGGFDDLYKKQKLKINNGALIYFYDTGNGDRIGTPIENDQLGVNVATKLVDLMQKYIYGERTVNGYNIYDLLSMRLYMDDKSKQRSPFNNTNNLVRISDDGKISIGSVSYDIMSQKQELISVISQMRNVINAKLLNENITSSENSVFSSAKQHFKFGNINSIELPNGIVFTKDDFLHKNSDGSYGTTWLGYMMRNNLLYTTAVGKSYKQLYVDGFRVVDKQNEQIDSTEKTEREITKEKQEEKVKRISKFSNIFDNLKGSLRYVSKNAPKSTKDQTLVDKMRQYLYKTLGKDDSIFNIVPGRYLDRIDQGYVLGYCTSQMLKICESAPMSVTYHEAFHRVLELLVPDKVREEIYSAYKAKNKNVKTDRDVAESLADKFVLFMDKTEGYRDATGLKSIIKFYKYAAQYLGLVSTLGFRRAYNMMNVYFNMNSGKYANVKISEDKIKRFERLFGDKLNYTVINKNGKTAEFKYLTNSSDVNDMVKALGYWIAKSIPLDRFSAKEFNIKTSDEFIKTLPEGLIDMLCGNDLQESELDDSNRAFREVFYKKTKLVTGKHGSAYVNSYPNLDVLLERVQDYIKSTITKFTEENDEYSDETLDEETEKEMSKNIDQYDKSSFESSKIDALPDNVKFFFSTIPYMTKTNDGIQLDLTKNKFGQPQFMPMNQVYNLLVNELYKCESIQELDKTLQAKSEQTPLYTYVYNKFHALYEKCYTTDENGNTITDYNAESYCIGLLSALHSQKLDFIVAISKQQEGGKQVDIKSSSLNRDIYTLTKQWHNILISGQVSVFNRGRDKAGHLIFMPGKGGKDGQDVFSKTADFIQDLVTSVESSGTIKINDVEYDLNDSQDLNDVENLFIDHLNAIGIIVSKDALDYMLQTKYTGTNADNFIEMLTNKGVDNIQSFIQKLNDIVSDAGIVDEKAIKNAYCKCGFVNDLATYVGKYRRSSIESMSLGLNGKKLHAVSQNNTISFIVSQLNTRDKNNATVRTLMKYGYNVSGEGPLAQGSIILEHILNNKPLDIHTATYIGSRTDNKNDGGTEYKEEPIVDDYMAKLTMLQNGILIFPTLADKGTWMCLSGIPIPGMTFGTTIEDDQTITTVSNIPTFIFKNGKAFIRPNNQVLDRMIAYANTERLALQQCMENLGYKNIPGYEKEGRKVLTDAEKIKNLHTNNGSVEPNGTRFLSLTEVAVLDEDGTVKLDKNGNIVTVNLNDPTKSSVEMLKRANEYFFTKKENETDEQFLNRQRDIMAYTLNVQYQLEVQTAVDLGIAKRTDVTKYDAKTKKDVTVFSKDDSSMFNVSSDYLNVDQVNALTNEILKTIPAWNNLPAGRQRTDAISYCKSLAIAAILSDATTRSIISANEVQRCFTGNPALFKVKYKGDHIADSTFDVQKRIGGIVSTGDDNAKQIPGIPRTYRCAECKDYEVKSQSTIYPRLRTMFEDTAEKDMYAILLQRKGYENAYAEAFSKNSNEMLSDDRLDEKDKQALIKAKQNGTKFASAFDGDINVADGQAYITEQMCENLLRLRGALTGEVKKAFDLLRSGEKYSWQEKADAYKLIYDKVNIVTTKYTAYGFRDHTLNGEDCSDVAVAYYNKYSLAPLFACMATGNMHNIYQKMQDEKVDMLLMTSAIKIGSQGAVKYNGNSIDDKFNTYEQDYSYLRRQLNTDPEEGSTSSLGTQMVKIVLQNLRTERDNYINSVTGERISGYTILNNLMDSINRLADIEYNKLLDEFGINQKTGAVDNKKLSNFLKSQLSSRNASKAQIEAVSLNENGEFNAPIAATSSSKWIESILISIISKRIADVVTPGNSFVQRSVFAMEDSSASENKIQSDKNMAPSINGGQRLQMVNEDGSMDAVISIDYFENILPKGLSFKEARQWLIDNKIIGNTGSGVKANTIGYRIPTQAQSSIHALRFVDVVPAVKCTIILPEEFTKITGSDFDIDHLYLATLNFNIDENNNVIDEEGLSEEKKLQNNILHTMMTLLKDTENSMHSLYKSIDNDTELITNLAEQLQEKASSKKNAYNFGTLHEQIYRRTDYVTGKFGIGPFALNVTNQVLTRLYRVKFAKTKFTEQTGIIGLDNIIDEDGNYIDSWLSAFINAHVDIVKDPYISKMNVNKYTYNMVNLLIRAGFGEAAMWFIAQPIIVDMATASNNAKSQFLLNKGTSMYSAEQEAVANAVSKYISSDKITEDKMAAFLDFQNEESVQQAVDCVNFIKNHKDALRQIVTKGLKPEDVVYDDVTVRDIQETIFFAWKALEKYAIALGNLVQTTKIDTKKQGKSLLEVYNYYNKYSKIFDSDENGLFDRQSLSDFVNGTWIDNKTNYICKLPFTVLRNQTFEGNMDYLSYIQRVYAELQPYATSLNVKQLKAISDAIKTSIKAQYIAKYAKEFLGMSDQDITNLFIGNRCMAYRLNMLNAAIRQNPKYARLGNNALIQQLYSLEESDTVFVNGEMCKKPNFISIADTVGDSNMNSDVFTDAWEDLLNDYDPFVRNFARHLIVYAYMTSGETGGWNSLFKYVPFSWLSGKIDKYQSFVDFVKDRLDKCDFDEYINLDDIVANIHDNNFCGRLFNKSQDNQQNIVYNNNRGLIATRATNIEPKQYLLYKAGRGYNQSDYDLYKLVSVIPTNEGNVPVYRRINMKGFLGQKKQFVLEYGWEFNYGENKRDNSTDYSTFDDKLQTFLKNTPADKYNKLTIDKIIEGVYSDENKQQSKPVSQSSNKPEQSDINQLGMSDFVMNSGGAHGADTAWDFYARQFGIVSINHFRDQDNTKLGSSLNKRGVKASVLSKEQMEYARQQIYNLLGIKYEDNIQGNLQVRNYYQVANSDAVFAIATMTDKKDAVTGGTNTAVQLGIKMQKPVHVFDIASEKWYSYNQVTKQFEQEETPILTQKFAGVGTRDIENYQVLKDGNWTTREQYVGEDKAKVALGAIRDVLNKTQFELNKTRKQSDNNTVNIYAGTNENIQLSNFANRPFDTKMGVFNTVEGAFQAAKLYYTTGDKYVVKHDGKRALTEQGAALMEKLKHCSGAEARQIGRSIEELDINAWNNRSTNILGTYMRMSYEQNKEFAKLLVSTGNKQITHKDKFGQEQDGGRFSQLLTEIRSELQSLQPNSGNIEQHVGNWSREEVQNNPDKLYIFTDNTDRDSGRGTIDPNSKYAKKYGQNKHYPKVTQAVIRGLDNAMPLSTQHWYNQTNKGATGVWTDTDIEEFKKVIDAEISDIMDEWDTGKYNTLVIGDGNAFFNSNISNISITRTPKLYNYLKSKVQQLYKYVDEHPHTKESTGSINQHGADQLTNSTLKQPKSYTQAINQIEKLFILNNETTVIGNESKKYSIQKLNVIVNNSYLSDVLSQTDLLNTLYKISKFADILDNMSDSKKVIVSDNDYDKFKRKVQILGYSVSEIEADYLIEEGEKPGTTEIPQKLFDAVDFLSSFDNNHRVFIQYIFDDAINQLLEDEQIDLSDVITITDTIEDTRQTDFLKELGMSDEDLKEAEKVKEHCKGGK